MNNSEQTTYELIAEWLYEYHSTLDSARKAKLKTLIVTKMQSVIKRIARTIARRSYDPIEDLVQAGSIGLLKAIDNYSNEVNDNFKIYAGYLIIGEMRHYLRDKLNTIRVPAYVQELLIRINSFTSTLTLEELNELTNDDVAEALKVSSTAVVNALQADRRKSTVSLEELYNSSNSDSLGYEEILSGDNYKENRELDDMRIALKEAITKLPDESKALIEMFYYEDLSQKEIADKLNISPMQVSRKLKKAFNYLYEMISGTSDEGDRADD